MKRFKRLITVVVLLCTSNCFGLTWGEYAPIVFSESTKIKFAPSQWSQDLGVIKCGENLTDYGADGRLFRADTINRESNYWIPINFKGKEAFVWGGDKAGSAFKSALNLDWVILSKLKRDSILELKILNKGKVFKSKAFKIDNPGKRSTKLYSLGITYKAEGKEVFCLELGYDENLRREFYEWDGEGLIKSKLHFDEFFKVVDEEDSTLPDYIIKSKVNLRSAPSIDSSIISNLSRFTEVEILNEYDKQDIVWGKEGHWSKVGFKGKEGYVWHDGVSKSKQKICSHRYQGIEYLYGTKAIIVFKNGVPIKCKTREYFPYIRKFYVKGNLGLGKKYEFLAAYYSGESCGVATGEVLFYWDGADLSYLVNEFGVGDGGEFEEFTYRFPINLSGIKGLVIEEFDAGVSYSYDAPICLNQNNQADYSSYKKHTKHFVLKNDSLVEIPTKYSSLAISIKKYKKGYSLTESHFCDLNNDGFEDVVFSANRGQASFIGYAFGSKSGDFTIKKSTYFLTQKAGLLGIETEGNIVNLYFASWTDEVFYQTLGFEILKDGNGVWKSRKTFAKKPEADGRFMEDCFVKEESFNAEKIPFEKAWVSFPE